MQGSTVWRFYNNCRKLSFVSICLTCAIHNYFMEVHMYVCRCGHRRRDLMVA